MKNILKDFLKGLCIGTIIGLIVTMLLYQRFEIISLQDQCDRYIEIIDKVRIKPVVITTK